MYEYEKEVYKIDISFRKEKRQVQVDLGATKSGNWNNIWKDYILLKELA